jgi:hypothetical protein
MSYTQRDLDPLVRGDDWTLKLTLTSSGSVLDITDYTFWFTLKTNIDDADPGAVQVSATSGSPDAAAGILYINVPRASTDGLQSGTYNYDVQQIDNNGNVQTLLIGKVKVVKDITRST